MNSKRKQIFRRIVIAGLLVIPPLLIYFSINYQGPLESPDNVIARPIVDNSVKIETLWTKKVQIIDEGLAAYDGIVFSSVPSMRQVFAIDLYSGEVIWTQPIQGTHELNVNPEYNQLYVNITFGANRDFIALNPQNGEIIWRNSSQYGSRSGRKVYVLPDGRVLSLSGGTGFLPVDLSTGDFGAALPLPELDPFLEHISDGVFWRIDSRHLESRRVEDGQVLWTSQYGEFPSRLMVQVLALADVVIVEQSALMTLDRQEGDLMWQYDDSILVTDIVSNDDVVIALDWNARLLIWDSETGEIINYVQFEEPTPDAKVLSNNIGMILRSQIAVVGDVIIIYFGDTDTLAAYQISTQ